MDFVSIVLQAIVEGITEFIPISSTGHIILIQELTAFNFAQKEFITVILQFSAILAAIFFFRKRILQISSESIINLKRRNIKNDLGIWILLSTIPILTLGYLFKDSIKIFQESGVLIGIMSIAFGILFYIIEKLNYNSSYSTLGRIPKFLNIFLINISQAFAFIPGVSRSGISISTGLLQKFNFRTSIELAFISGIPVILIASLYEIVKSLNLIKVEDLLIIIIGCTVSFITAFFSIKFTIGFLERKGFYWFMLYRIFFGIILILLFIKI